MYLPVALTEIDDKDDGSETCTQTADEVDTVVNSMRTLLVKEPDKPLLQSTRALRRLSLILHLTLVSVHLILVGIWATNFEKRLIFPFDTEQNKRTSLIITIISTTITFAALLVFVTQRLWMRHSIQKAQTLTATHDHAAAWAGIGAAISHVWYQKAVPASITGVLSVLFYLGGILILHITTPALFSLATFTSPRISYIMSTDAHVNSVFNQYTAGSLYFLPSVVGNATNLGLWDSTLYEVPDVNTGSGNVTVAAIGFNITCGYLTHVMDQFTYDDSHASWQANWTSDDANRTLEIANTRKVSNQPDYMLISV
ncbi:hypothetical protein B0H11DRAFT_1868643 [Mycena galericulata]|nr:hypothetical protein B0H11DRAFT_1868643 [Mycena galericulata]